MTIKKETRRVYKIVGVDTIGVYHSWLWYIHPYIRSNQDIALKYNIDEITYPSIKGSLLFAFRTLKAAKDFIGNDSSPSILRCDAKVSKTRFNFIASHWILEDIYDDTSYRNIDIFWSKPEISIQSMSVPEDTVFCEWIRPVAVVSKVRRS